MDNMGGVAKLFMIDSEKIANLSQGEGIWNLSFQETSGSIEIPVTIGSGSFRETEELSDDGLLYNVEINARIAKSLPGDSLSLAAFFKKRCFVGLIDNNDKCWMFGDYYYYGSYFNLSRDKQSGSQHADYNGEAIKITASIIIPSIQVDSLTTVYTP